MVDGASRDGGIDAADRRRGGAGRSGPDDRRPVRSVDDAGRTGGRLGRSRRGAARSCKPCCGPTRATCRRARCRTLWKGLLPDLPPAGFEPEAGRSSAKTVVSTACRRSGGCSAPMARSSLNNDPAVAAAPLPPAEPGLLDRRGPDGTFLDEVEQERRVFNADARNGSRRTR